MLRTVNTETVCGNSAEIDHSEERDNHLFGNLSALHWLSNNDVNGLSSTLQERFRVEDDDLVKKDEVEMVLQKEICLSTCDENNEDRQSEEAAKALDFLDNDVEV